MKSHEPTTIRRDCQAVQIPSGEKTRLPAGTPVTITQALGDTFTVITEHGQMMRVAGTEADALGMEVAPPAPAPAAGPLTAETIGQRVWDQLRTLYDPEIPVNIVDLGLIYLCRVQPLPGGGHRAEVRMTLTAPGCGMGDVLKEDAERKISRVPGVTEVRVDVVFDPPWSPSMMSDAARLELGIA